ncbi:DNA-binding HxlR family transcriptional regulator [Natronocella acetinitrilica]|uniref:DNA-binding HxlR family transcriptional regulator n=1 Tax=Natronocella acetinitrilica TaxID=414046 RepID=A0AAE3G510_9GAMM|nr:helix-turn-helix domain-containing protein [Natronocella acetinitrilica]MCP1675179.1 DNA-binding HxlR family transcriptional regulator [Natronocella acetinitrilica]
MKGYGQFCPLALASEIVGERWTTLVIRELMLGSHRFNEIHRGVPRMSPTLLTRRLRTLEKAGIVERRRSGGRTEYVLSEAGAELAPTLESLAVWSKRRLPATLSEDRADPDLVMWDMHRRMHLERMPHTRTVIQFEFTDQPVVKRLRWIIGDSSGVDLCITDPGLDADLFVTTDSGTITLVWYGDLPLRRALTDGQIRLHGPRRLCEAFPSWLQLSLLADIPRRRPAATEV